MTCPVCANELNPVRAGQVVVDVCLGGCGGIWFDPFELQKLELAEELETDFLISVNETSGDSSAFDSTRKRRCPKCRGMAMMRHFFSSRRQVEVDECPSCGGYWLDAGELALVRGECRTEAECRKAVEKYLSEATGASLAKMSAGTVQQVKQAQVIHRLLRFSHPIRYQRQTGSRPASGARS